MEITETRLKNTIKNINTLNNEIELTQKQNNTILINFQDASTSLLLNKNLILNLLKEEACKVLKQTTICDSIHNQINQNNDKELELTDLLSELLISKTDNERLQESMYLLFLEREKLNKTHFKLTSTLDNRTNKDSYLLKHFSNKCKQIEANITDKKKEIENKVREHDKLISHTSIIMKKEVYLTSPTKNNLEMYIEKMQSLEFLDKINEIIKTEKNIYQEKQVKIKNLTKKIAEMKKNSNNNSYIQTIVDDSVINQANMTQWNSSNLAANYNTNYATNNVTAYKITNNYSTNNYHSNNNGSQSYNNGLSKQYCSSTQKEHEGLNTIHEKDENQNQNYNNDQNKLDKKLSFLPRENINSKNSNEYRNDITNNENKNKQINKADYSTNMNVIYNFNDDDNNIHENVSQPDEVNKEHDSYQLNYMEANLDQTIDSENINFPDKVRMNHNQSNKQGLFLLGGSFNNSNKRCSLEENIIRGSYSNTPDKLPNSNKYNSNIPNNNEVYDTNNYNSVSIPIPKLNFGTIHNTYKNDKSVIVKESNLNKKKDKNTPNIPLPKYNKEEDKKLLQMLKGTGSNKLTETAELERQVEETENVIEELKQRLIESKEKFRKNNTNNKNLKENIEERDAKIKDLEADIQEYTSIIEAMIQCEDVKRESIQRQEDLNEEKVKNPDCSADNHSVNEIISNKEVDFEIEDAENNNNEDNSNYNDNNNEELEDEDHLDDVDYDICDVKATNTNQFEEIRKKIQLASLKKINK